MSVKVHLPKMISAELLTEHPKNTQVQSSHTFAELQQNIEEHGFDENLLAVPRTDGAVGY